MSDKPYHFSLKSVEIDGELALKKRGLGDNDSAQQFIDSEVLRLCDPLIPQDTGALIASGLINTRLGSGEIKYRTPYARRWYYMPAAFQVAHDRGNYWFERMKSEGGKEQIMKGVRKIVGGNK